MDSLELILQELKKINGRLDGLDSKVSGLERKVDKLQTGMDERKEAREITRDGVDACRFLLPCTVWYGAFCSPDLASNRFWSPIPGSKGGFLIFEETPNDRHF